MNPQTATVTIEPVCIHLSFVDNDFHYFHYFHLFSFTFFLAFYVIILSISFFYDSLLDISIPFSSYLFFLAYISVFFIFYFPIFLLMYFLCLILLSSPLNSFFTPCVHTHSTLPKIPFRSEREPASHHPSVQGYPNSPAPDKRARGPA